jgi:aminomethyltransferase
MIYDGQGRRIGYATELHVLPVMQRHIGIARVRPTHAEPGTEVFVEQAVNHEYVNARALVTSLPFYNPPRKVSAR